jgi:uncharacterized protein (DUF1330 family)
MSAANGDRCRREHLEAAGIAACLRYSLRFDVDQRKLAAYAKLAVVATAPFGARFLARGNPAAAYEQGLKERTVVTEYPSLEKATASYSSPAYQEALKALGDGAVRDVRIIEGSE